MAIAKLSEEEQAWGHYLLLLTFSERAHTELAYSCRFFAASCVALSWQTPSMTATRTPWRHQKCLAHAFLAVTRAQEQNETTARELGSV